MSGTQYALRRLKTVQAWRKSLNEFKAARLTCLGCGGKDAVFCRFFTDTETYVVKYGGVGQKYPPR
jgi:hypothetical protein